ncbi:MAG: hypothetical protein CMD99_01255 [Gammaproteobacteria bacterium]|nr:hypothetical protein [Gammaproteobacteria bacterium]
MMLQYDNGRVSVQRVISSFLVFACVLAASFVQAQGPFGSSFGGLDLIPAEQAFTVSHPKVNVIEISIADGTYLYDERTIVQNEAGAILKTSRSTAEIYDDPLFGPTPIHTNKLRMVVTDAPDLMVLTFQGCADIGFCYPPQQTELSFSR